MDRFDSKEHVEFHEHAFDQGREARGLGYDMFSQNPYKDNPRSWLCKSFNAGWADKDAEIAEAHNDR